MSRNVSPLHRTAQYFEASRELDLLVVCPETCLSNGQTDETEVGEPLQYDVLESDSSN